MTIVDLEKSDPILDIWVCKDPHIPDPFEDEAFFDIDYCDAAKDYVDISPDQWKFLYETYGGGPAIPRTVYLSFGKEYEVEDRPVYYQFMLQTDPHRRLVGLFSCFTTVNQAKQVMCSRLSLDPKDVRFWDHSPSNGHSKCLPFDESSRINSSRSKHIYIEIRGADLEEQRHDLCKFANQGLYQKCTEQLEWCRDDLDFVFSETDFAFDPRNPEPDRVTALSIATFLGYKRIVQLLLSHGASASAVINGKTTALHMAAAMNRAEIAEILVNAGADSCYRDYQNRKPLDVAVEYNRRAAIEYLLNLECLRSNTAKLASDSTSRLSVLPRELVTFYILPYMGGERPAC